jgi:thioredoxin reductase (NADPH)
MAEHGTKMIRPAVPTSIEKLPSGKLMVHWKHDVTGLDSDEYDTVLFAVGRTAETQAIGLDKAGVIVDQESGKIAAVNERTNVPHIYAIGDILKDRLELTPVAIQAGRLLARRLFNGSQILMDYVNVPTTIFTPIEYGCVGFAEDAAIRIFGEDNIEVYHSYFRPLEWNISGRPDNVCYAKVITNLKDNERVIGFHIVGPNAGEITQGFGAAIKSGLTKEILDNTVGIHPTTAEEFTTLSITKRSGISPEKHGC